MPRVRTGKGLVLLLTPAAKTGVAKLSMRIKDLTIEGRMPSPWWNR
jgi:hypothetical protein